MASRADTARTWLYQDNSCPNGSRNITLSSSFQHASLQKQRRITTPTPVGTILYKRAKQKHLRKQKLSQRYHSYIELLLHPAGRAMWHEGQSSLVLPESVELGIKLRYYMLGNSKQEHQLQYQPNHHWLQQFIDVKTLLWSMCRKYIYIFLKKLRQNKAPLSIYYIYIYVCTLTWHDPLHFSTNGNSRGGNITLNGRYTISSPFYKFINM